MRTLAVAPWGGPSAMAGPLPAPPPRDGAALVGRRLGPYRVDAELGRGGMGVVYRAHDARLGRPVALKLLPPGAAADAASRERLLREARTVAALDHPHLAAVYDVGEADDGRLFVAMAFYDGETLEARLARGPLPPDEAAEIAAQVAAGLGAAHRAGVVHRDVKPANVMLVAGGAPSVRVLDFGIARTEDPGLTAPDQSVGTALYMSPEQLRGGPVDARADVWGLGVVLYEMLAGHRPFGGAYAAAIGYAVLHEDPPPLAGELPDRLPAVVSRCLAKDPADRYGSMEALAEALRGEPAPQAPAPRLRAEGRRAGGRLRRWAAAALAGLAVALAAVALWPEAQATGGAQRLVVLPFRADGADAEALAAGLVEAATANLASLGALRARVSVVPASEVEPGMTPTEAHEALGATLVVEGRVATEDEAVRVTLSLATVGPDGATQAGTRQIDDASGSAFALQDAAALEVADLVGVTVADADRDALAAGGTADAEANELYLRARGVLRNQQSLDDLDRARDLFAQALGLDPDFALAVAGLALAEWETFRRTDDPAWAERALATVERAVRLAEDVVETHVAQAVILRGQGEPARALAAIDRAVALAPDDADAVRRRAKILDDLGRADEAEAAFRRAVELAPDFWRTYNSLGVFYINQGRPDAADEQFRLGLERSPANLSLLGNQSAAAWLRGDLDHMARISLDVLRLDPDNQNATLNLSLAQFYLGDLAGAAETAEDLIALQPDGVSAHDALAWALWWTPGMRDRARDQFQTVVRLGHKRLAIGRDLPTLTTMAHAWAVLGQPDSARAYLREAEALVPESGADVQDAFVMGCAYEVAGERSQALRWLGRALRRGYGTEQLRRSPWLADLRDDPLAASLLPSTTPHP